MSDFTSGFWNYYIAILVTLSIIGCTLLLFMQSRSKSKLATSTDPRSSSQTETTGHVWDEDLTELNTPMPRWWMWLFYITIVFAIVYLVLYPGFGTYAGKLGWTSGSEYKQEIAKADADYGPLFAKYQKLDLKTVAADPQAHAIGERLFMTYCSQCHGSDAHGGKGFPNLTGNDWLFGGEPDVIETTILHGRNGVMPSMAAAVGTDQDVENVAHYVASLSGTTSDPIKASMGKAKFGICAACHTATGEGNKMLGAPNLTDKNRSWLFGRNIGAIMETIHQGRSSTMPAFENFLGEAKVHLLAAYVWSLSHTQGEAK